MAGRAFEGLSGVTEIDPDAGTRVQGGAVAPLMALLLVPVLGSVSFAVDGVYLSTTSRQTQGASDAAALAGAGRLFSSYVAVSGAGNRK